VEERPRHNNYMESNNNKLQKIVKANPSIWDFMVALRDAYRGDFQLIYTDWVNGVVNPRKTKAVERDKRILQQVKRWVNVCANKLRPDEWARGMVLAMMDK
jgi:hypothetical protein